MRKLFTIAILAATSLVAQSTQNMGRTYTASQNVRYANAGGAGTTLHKLAKLIGAPSTAIITAITDTSGIVGIVVAGSGNTGSADIAFAGKASCVFDSATTAGHYVVNDTSTAGDCMDGGATFPTSGQVIGVVTSTNGGAGTYEVDMTLRQSRSAAGGGSGLVLTRVVLTALTVLVSPDGVLAQEIPTGAYTTPIIDLSSGSAQGRYRFLAIIGDSI